MALFTAPLLLLLLLALLAGRSSCDIAFITELCNESQHRDVCMSMLSDNPCGLSCADTYCVASVSTETIVEEDTSIRIYIRYLLAGYRAPPELVAPLADCDELYMQAKVVDLAAAASHLAAKDHRSASDAVTSAWSVPRHCEEGFGGGGTPLTERNKKFEDMCDVTWEIIDRLLPTKK